jgi:hypothetical protein
MALPGAIPLSIVNRRRSEQAKYRRGERAKDFHRSPIADIFLPAEPFVGSGTGSRAFDPVPVGDRAN